LKIFSRIGFYKAVPGGILAFVEPLDRLGPHDYYVLGPEYPGELCVYTNSPNHRWIVLSTMDRGS
jgi:hypothetical protein